MVLTRNEELLFTHVFSMINQFIGDQGRIFHGCLRRFIREGYITYLPRSQLVELIEGLVVHKEIAMLESLLLFMDLKRNDTSLLLHYCMENSLFKYTIIVYQDL